MKSEVSIIIPTYNRYHFLGETLDSIILQDYQNWECLVIDDHSTDYTKELMEFYTRKDSRIKYQIRPDSLPKGANSCRNYGYGLSVGTYINWFDDDDYMLPGLISEKIEKFKEETYLVISSYFHVDEYLKRRIPLKLEKPYGLFKSYALYRLEMVTNSVMFKKSFLNGKMLFEPFLIRGQETELFMRIFYDLTESQYEIIDEPLFLYRNHEGSKSQAAEKSKTKYRKSLIYLASKFIEKGVSLNDMDIIRFHYRKSVRLYFHSIKERQTNDVKFFNKILLPMVIKLNFMLGVEIYLAGKISWFLNRSSHRIEKRLKNYLN